MIRPVALVLPLAAAVAAAPPSLGQGRFDDVEIKATHVAGSVYMLEGAGGNIGVSVGDDGILIVDDQFAELADRIRAALGRLGEGKLRFVLNTHYHGDHVGGNPVFGAEATIVAHHNVRKRLASPQEGARPRDAMVAAGLPVITFDDSLTVHFNGEEIRMIHVPHGHTDGDSVVHFTGSKVVHMGDQMFAGRFPFVDLEAGGDVEGYARNVEKVIAHVAGNAGVKVIPGHGPLSTVDDMRAFAAALEETTRIVRSGMKEGKAVDVLVEEGLPEKYADWGSGFISTERWIRTIHDSLSGK